MRPALLILLLAAPARALWFGPRAKSAWVSKRLVLDCDEAEWDQGALDDSDGITYGFANDDEFLYAVYVPRTKLSKFQLSGGYRQTFTIWVYPGAAIRKTAGFSAAAPGNGEPAAMQPAGTAAPTLTALAALPEPDRRSVLEARLPLRALGVAPGQTIAVGLEASAPDHWPSAPASKDGKPAAPQEKFAPIRIWVRVRLAKAPSR